MSPSVRLIVSQSVCQKLNNNNCLSAQNCQTPSVGTQLGFNTGELMHRNGNLFCIFYNYGLRWLVTLLTQQRFIYMMRFWCCFICPTNKNVICGIYFSIYQNVCPTQPKTWSPLTRNSFDNKSRKFLFQKPTIDGATRLHHLNQRTY